MGQIGGLMHQIDDGTLSDERRRQMLLTTTGVLGGLGLLAAAYPFVASFEPSERDRALGGPVDADISGLAAGELQTLAWRGKPVWLMRRTPDMVRALEQSSADLADPLSKRSEQPVNCVNVTRSQRPEIFVAVGVCTHLGCTPKLLLDDSALNAELHAPGGFFCPCHGSRFDLAGRVLKNVPAPVNLEIPDYRFTSATTVVIG